MVEDMEQYVRDIVDRQAISDVLHNYCRAVDRQDRALLAAVYHEDAVDFHGVYNGPISGMKELGARMIDEYLITQHAISNIMITLEGDVAHAESYLNAMHRRRTPQGKVLDDFLRCRYADRLERRDGIWRIARRVVIYDWGETRPAGDRAWWDDVPGDYRFGQRNTQDAVYTEGVAKPR